MLTIREGSLKPGLRYRIEVTVRTSSGVESSASKSITVNASPSRDPLVGCVVSPLQGVELSTKYTVSCGGWTDDDVPLVYDLQVSNPGNGDSLAKRITMISNSASAEFAAIVLPKGYGLNDSLTLIVVARDSLGASSEADLRVSCSKYVFDGQTDLVSLSSSLLESFSSSNGAGERDMSSVLQVVSVVSQVFAGSLANDSDVSNALLALSNSPATAQESVCPDCGVHGSCVSGTSTTGETMMFCQCEVGWTSPLCNLNKTEVDMRAALRDNLLSLVLDGPSQMDDERADKASLLAEIEQKLDIVAAVSAQPLEITPKSSQKIETFLQSAARSTTAGGASSDVVQKLGNVLSNFVLAVGLGSATQLTSAEDPADAPSQTLEKVSRQSVVVSRVLVDLGQTLSKNMAPGEPPLTMNTPTFKMDVVRPQPDTLQT
eukprot:ANDGO_01491.mRNA.1 hypothetical protein H310_13163